MILLLFYNATTVCLFVLVLRGWEYGGGMLCGIVGHFQILITSSKSSRFLHYFQYLTISLVLCVCLEIVVCPFDFFLLATVLSVLRFTDYDSHLVSSNSSYSLLEILFLTLHGVPLMCVLRALQ